MPSRRRTEKRGIGDVDGTLVSYAVARLNAAPVPRRVEPFSRDAPLRPKTGYRIVIARLGGTLWSVCKRADRAEGDISIAQIT